MSSDEEGERLESGVGILEFSPDKAGRDVTPANYDFRDRDKRQSGTLSSIAGETSSRNLILLQATTARTILGQKYITKPQVAIPKLTLILKHFCCSFTCFLYRLSAQEVCYCRNAKIYTLTKDSENEHNCK